MNKKNSGLLRLIAIFKLFKAIALIAVGFGALHLFHDGVPGDSVTLLIAKFGFNPGGHYVDLALGKLSNIPPKDFKDLGIGSFVYAALFLTEGIGLWLAKPWAEWFTTIITSSLVPLEIFEIYRHPTATKVIVLLLNIAIAVYLILRIRKERSSVNETH
ncbi:DUF2127 domain-containing protein [Tunturiibacter empetritectus]|uniref:Uncharacterized membrane protein (DUF2068 family) n=1 Tax=Tunturiibacter lichenicola TaxID=2051959 RepID=A0A852VI77_9BACT|nr:DUF2127 domain-containing protein [Edaphobacter lichenicola]NYF91407.1 uncharacterized membrane protein (DUF2068 family) [Edaphobacter lichenicola]